MVKVESGLFNRLSGTLQKSRTTFQTRKTGIVAEKKPIPPKDARGRRECVRWIYRYLCDKWNTLSEQEKEQYSETAEKHNITLFNAFLKQELTPRLWKCKLYRMDGLVVYLPLIEGEGNVVRDFSGYNNNGTIYGATWQKIDNKAIVIYGDGIDDYIEIQHNESLNLDEFTILAWINVHSIPSPTDGHFEISSKGTSVLRFFVQNVLKQLKTVITIGTTTYHLTHSEIVELNRWYFAATTIKSSEQAIMLNDNYEVLGTLTYDELAKSTVNLNILRHSTTYSHGQIALWALFNRALSKDELMKIYNSTKQYFL